MDEYKKQIQDCLIKYLAQQKPFTAGLDSPAWSVLSLGSLTVLTDCVSGARTFTTEAGWVKSILETLKVTLLWTVLAKKDFIHEL